MCLVTEQKKAKILKKDLTVYKIVTEYGGEIYGWLRDDYKYEIGKLHEEKLVANKKTGSITDYIASEAYNKIVRIFIGDIEMILLIFMKDFILHLFLKDLAVYHLMILYMSV